MTTRTESMPPAETSQATTLPRRQLSLAQEQLWFLEQLAPDQTTYNSMLIWRLNGPLQVELLQRSLELVVARHESLRVTIDSEDGTPYQVVAAPATVPLPVLDLRSLPTAERESRMQAEIEALRNYLYDLTTGPLCRFQLFRLAEEEYVFYQGFHHIVTDGWSIAVINAELTTAYRSLYSGVEPVFEDRTLDFTEFAESQRQYLQGAVLAEELEFWRQQLADLPVLELPTDRPRPADGIHQGNTLIQDFSPDLHGLIKQLAADHGASMFMVFTAALNLVLSRYSGLTDLPIGYPMFGRSEPELEPLVGMFVNLVVLRSDLSGDPTFSELIDRIADGSLGLYEHQEVSFNQVVEAVHPARDASRNPLFQVCTQMLGESNSGENLNLPEVHAEYVPLRTSQRSRFDITVSVLDTGGGLRSTIEYSATLFDEWRILALLDHLETVVRAAAADPGQRLSQLPIVAGAEADQLIAAGQQVPEEYRAKFGPLEADCQFYLVDPSLNLVPRGVPGEVLLSVAGSTAVPDGLAEPAGDDPFRPGRLLYRTGDRARWTSDLRLAVGDSADDQSELTAEPTGASGSAEPSTPTEQAVAGIFGAVLTRTDIGADDSFFDIGGTSLQAMRVISRINKQFGVKLSVRMLYGNVTVRAVAAAVDERIAGRPA